MTYEDFAQCYDRFMEQVPYEEWADWICQELQSHGIMDGLILELGCGTGNMTELLAQRGYDMIGIDASAQMLAEALNKRDESGHDILYLEQDMREFELYGTVRAVICVFDSINYICSPQELLTVFRLVNNYLDPGGLFLFDFNTVHKYRDLMGECVLADADEDCSYIWENSFDPSSMDNTCDLTLFLRREDGCYVRIDEEHVQHAYSLEQVLTLLKKAGLCPEAVFEAYTSRPGDENAERLLIAAREQGKIKIP